MRHFSKLEQTYIWPFLLLIVADGLIVANIPPLPHYVAALILLLIIPGWGWCQTLFRQPADIIEHITLAVGLSLALTIFGAMFAVYLPGPLTVNQLLITINAITIAGLLTAWYAKRNHPCSPSPHLFSPVPLLILLALLLLAAALRLPRLGYAEFHEDEAEALMLGVRLLQGEDYALFLHRKGPAQMLVPVTFWLLTGQINETLARFPFALSSILSVITLFFIGRRWFNWQTGLVAGLLWAINGYAIGFGRMVQYQALIFFLGPLSLYCLYLAWEHSLFRFQILGIILLAASLLAHFDALLFLPIAGYLLSKGVSSHKRELEGLELEIGGDSTPSQPPPSRGRSLFLPLQGGLRGVESPSPSNPKPLSSRLWTSLLHPRTLAPLLRSRLVTIAISLSLFLALLASFYVPYLLDPEFQNTAGYLTETRVKPGLLYNNLDLLRRLDRDYSSHFYLLMLTLGIISYIGRQGTMLQKKWRWIMAGLILSAALTFWMPDIWQIKQLNLAILPWLLLGIVCFRFSSTIKARAVWVMFGAGFIGYVFLVDDPRTHLYIIYPGAVLLAGAGWASLVGQVTWPASAPTLHPSNASTPQLSNLPRSIILTAGTLLAIAVIIYDIAIFLQTESSFTRLRNKWDGSAWETVYDSLPKTRDYFGYPKNEGWKTIGALRAQGHFAGDFRSINEDFIIPIWYNYGRARSCYNTPAHVFVRAAAGDTSITDKAYTEVGRVKREDEVRLRIFSTGVKPDTVINIYSAEDFTDIFDRLTTPQQFARQAQPAHFVGTQFGETIDFVGYDLPTTTISAGDTLHLNLYWQALKNPGSNYRAFVHLTDGAALWGQQDDDPACRLPTSIWRAGQRGVGQFRLPIDPNTPPGRYPLIIGLYQADTLERLKITAGTGQLGDDFLWLGDVEVTASAIK